ncbi:MAG: glycine dehydrogenase, partial [Promethearchaeota archaeon]
MDFVPHDDDTITEMLKVIGVNKIEDLFNDIPKDLIINGLNLPEGLSEPDVLKKLKELGGMNTIYTNSFLGAGCYFHYIPTLVDFVVSRSEFYTSYTPYQAEASQGYLQAIYEYQSVISRLTQMDVANASMYDGSTALAEAAIMASIITRKNQILILEGVHPEYVEVVSTYCWGQNIAHKIVPIDKIEDELNQEIAAVLFQSPNFFGNIEDVSVLAKKIRNTAPN